MQFFYSQFQNTLTRLFLVYFFFLNVRQTIIHNELNYLKIHICRLTAPLEFVNNPIAIWKTKIFVTFMGM